MQDFCPSAVWSLWVVADCGDLGSDGSLALNHETLHDADGKAAQEKDHPKPYQPQPYPEPYLNLPKPTFCIVPINSIFGFGSRVW